MRIRRGELEVSGDCGHALIASDKAEPEDVGFVTLDGDDLRWLQAVALPTILATLPTTRPEPQGEGQTTIDGMP